MAGTFGLLGDTQAHLTASGFFHWFNLEPTDETEGPDTLVYRPSGDAFHKLVSLVAGLGPDKSVQSLSLNVARSFIDDARQSAFARDIVKSFLQAVGSSDSPELTSLANEIMFREPKGTILMRGETPPLPAEPSAGFLTFKGAQAAWSIDLTRLKLTMTNETAGEAHLTVHVEPLRGDL